MTATARIELAGIQVICTQPKARAELAGVQVICTQPKCRIELAGVLVEWQGTIYEPPSAPPTFPLETFIREDLRIRSYAMGYPKLFWVSRGAVHGKLGEGVITARTEPGDIRGWRWLLKNLTAADYHVFENFYHRLVYRSAVAFNMLWPQMEETILVRFWEKEPPTWDPIPESPFLQDLHFAVVEV